MLNFIAQDGGGSGPDSEEEEYQNKFDETDPRRANTTDMEYYKRFEEEDEDEMEGEGMNIKWKAFSLLRR